MIALRSPYFVIVNNTNLTSADLSVYIHTGSQSATVSGAQYSLSGDAISETVVFDIAELARDYIDSTFSGTYSCTAVWVNYQVTEYISSVAQTPSSVVQLAGVDGYTYFEDGVSSSSSTYTTPDIMQSNTVIYKYTDSVFRVPVLQDNVTRVSFMHKGRVSHTETVSSTTTSTDIIRYVSNTTVSTDTFKARVEADSGTYEEAADTGYTGHLDVFTCDSVIVETTSGNTRLSVVDIDECRYDPVKVTFVNKFGALQDFWFFKVNKLSMSVRSDTYKKTLISSGSYTTTHHAVRDLRRNAVETLQLNSGLYDAQYNEVFRQLLLSESVWVEYEGATRPVRVTSSDFTEKTSLNDKAMITFALDVEFSNNKLNNIR